MKKTSDFWIDNIIKFITFVLFLIIGLSLIMTIVWAINTSLKSAYDYILHPLDIFGKKHFINYVNAFRNIQVEVWSNTRGLVIFDVFNMFAYSVIIAAVMAIMNVILPALTSYAVARYNFVGKKLLYNLAILVMIIPIIGSLPSTFAIRKALNTYDNLIPFLLTSGSGFGFNFILLYGLFRKVPTAFAEAAIIDGAGHARIMTSIYFRLSLSMFFVLFMLGFVGSWNDYMTVVTFLPTYPNLAYGVYMYEYKASIEAFSVPEILAGLIIVAIPSVILWTAGQKYMTANLTAGGLKG